MLCLAKNSTIYYLTKNFCFTLLVAEAAIYSTCRTAIIMTAGHIFFSGCFYTELDSTDLCRFKIFCQFILDYSCSLFVLNWSPNMEVSSMQLLESFSYDIFMHKAKIIAAT